MVSKCVTVDSRQSRVARPYLPGRVWSHETRQQSGGKYNTRTQIIIPKVISQVKKGHAIHTLICCWYRYAAKGQGQFFLMKGGVWVVSCPDYFPASLVPRPNFSRAPCGCVGLGLPAGTEMRSGDRVSTKSARARCGHMITELISRRGNHVVLSL